MFIGLLVRSDDERLLGSGSSDVKSSPFVIASKDGGLIGFDSFMNVVIMVSVVSIGMSGVYGGSRTLTALGEQGYAPKIFTYIDRSGRPLFSVAAILLMGALAYMNLAASGETVFGWLLQLSGLAALFTWGSICLAHIRFRKAWAYHGHTLDEIPFKAVGGVYGSWLGLILIFLVLVATVRSSPPLIHRSNANLCSSTPLSRPLAQILAPPKTFSTRTLPSSSWASSGFADTSGSALDGSARTKSTSTVAGGSSTGTTSTSSVKNSLLGPLGGVSCLTYSRARVGSAVCRVVESSSIK